MEYKLLVTILLSSFIKGTGHYQSGGAIKGYLAKQPSYSMVKTKTYWKKIHIGDVVAIPEDNITINIIEPTAKKKNILKLC